jgi:hypothetical protein
MCFHLRQKYCFVKSTTTTTTTTTTTSTTAAKNTVKMGLMAEMARTQKNKLRKNSYYNDCLFAVCQEYNISQSISSVCHTIHNISSFFDRQQIIIW